MRPRFRRLCVVRWAGAELPAASTRLADRPGAHAQADECGRTSGSTVAKAVALDIENRRSIREFFQSPCRRLHANIAAWSETLETAPTSHQLRNGTGDSLLRGQRQPMPKWESGTSTADPLHSTEDKTCGRWPIGWETGWHGGTAPVTARCRPSSRMAAAHVAARTIRAAPPARPATVADSVIRHRVRSSLPRAPEASMSYRAVVSNGHGYATAVRFAHPR